MYNGPTKDPKVEFIQFIFKCIFLSQHHRTKTKEIYTHYFDIDVSTWQCWHRYRKTTGKAAWETYGYRGNDKYMLFDTSVYILFFLIYFLVYFNISLYFQIMLTVASTFTFCIICFYGLYQVIMDRDSFFDVTISIYTIWCVFYLILIVFIIIVGSATTREVSFRFIHIYIYINFTCPKFFC